MTIDTQTLNVIISFLTFLGVLVVPFITYKLTIALEERRQTNQTKLWIYGRLMETRHDPLNEEGIRALNLIDVVFCDNKKVREAWGVYYEYLSDPRLNNQPGYAMRDSAKIKLLSLMAQSLGKYSNISEVDFSRIYTPGSVQDRQLVEMYERQHKIAYYQKLLNENNIQPNATPAQPSPEAQEKMSKEEPNTASAQPSQDVQESPEESKD